MQIKLEEFWWGASEKFSETWRLLAVTRRRGEMNQNGEISSSHGERPQVWSMRWFQPQLKMIYCHEKSVCHFFCGLINSFELNLFLSNSTTLSFSKLSLFLVVSEIKCKCGNNKRLWPTWNFTRNNTFLSITM